MVSLFDRIGNDAGGTRLEDALQWAEEHGFHYIDFNADRGANHLDSWDDDRVRSIRDVCDRAGIHIGLHTLSAINVADFSPRVSEGVDEYLRANVDLANRLGCGWLVVHAGLHFSAAVEDRMRASQERLKRLTEYAEKVHAHLLLENLNREPETAEVHYLAHNVEECRYYFDAIRSDCFGWAFTVNHAHMVLEGIDGHLDAFGIDRLGEVRLADTHGEYEIHLPPGQGTIDFESVFRRIEGMGYKGHYMMAFGTAEDRLAARNLFAGYE
jgi:sugar phosphate isomerase/epimerase